MSAMMRACMSDDLRAKHTVEEGETREEGTAGG